MILFTWISILLRVNVSVFTHDINKSLKFVVGLLYHKITLSFTPFFCGVEKMKFSNSNATPV